MVSVIIPAYNCEKYISKCIDSILHQDESSIEIIIIDDGSQDATALILDRYAKQDNRIRVVHIENAGPSKARNIAIDRAQGDWILFVDSDDWVDTNILSKLDLSITSPDIIFFGFKRYYEHAPQEVCIPNNYKTEGEQVYSQLKELLNSKNEFFGYSVNKVYRRSIIEEHHIRFKEGLSVREDEAFALNYCLYINSIQVVAFAPYNYRILNDSLSHNKNRFRNYRLLIRTELGLLNLYPQVDFKDAFISRIFTYYILSIIECINLNLLEKYDVIDDAIEFFDQNKQWVAVPKWQVILFECPIKFMRKYIIYIIFCLRGCFK